MSKGKRPGPGEGSIYYLEARGKWAAVVHVRDAGRRRRITREAPTQREALRKLDELRRAAGEGGRSHPSV